MQGKFPLNHSRLFCLLCSFFCFSAFSDNPPQDSHFTKDDGYRGIWYAVGLSKDEYE